MADKVQNMVKEVLGSSENVLNRALDNPYISTTLKVFLGLYAAFAAPQLPKSLANMMDHTVVRIVFAFLIVFMATRDPSLALMIAVAFIITLQTANKFRLYNTSLSRASAGEVSWLPSVNNVTSENVVEVEGEAEMPVVNEARTAEQSLISDNLNTVVENMEGAEVPNSVENASSVENVFTSEQQFNDAQSDNVPGANQESCVKSWGNQHCVQGLEENSPSGYSGLEHSDF